MSNKTQAAALSVRGQNPQNLIEAVIRNKIYQNRYWKEKLPGLTAASIIDEALELDYVGGTYGGNRKPSKFLMLSLKLLQISPEKAEVMEYINQEDYKYLTALGCFYIRLVASSEDIYKILEPLYADYRKLRIRDLDGSFKIIHMDEFVENLINQEVYLDTLLPNIQKRRVLEENGALQQRAIPQLLQQEIEREEEELRKQMEIEEEQKQQAEEANNDQNKGEEQQEYLDREKSQERKKKKKKHRKHSSSRSHSRSNSRDRKKKSHKHRSWRSVIKGGSNRDRKSKSRSRSSSNEPRREKQPDKNSIEFWNIERAKLGLPLL
ncbi:hypothetical protein ABPG74_021323 [Tetrahymena malaccensis]